MLRMPLISVRVMRGMMNSAGLRSASVGNRNIQTSSKRLGGGHGHGHGDHAPQKPLGPYELPHHDHYPSKAHLFGIDPSVPYKREGWEVISWATYIIMFGLIMSANWDMKKDDKFKVWARNEALARRKVIENGGEIEFGRYYSDSMYEEDEVDTAPKAAEHN